MSNSSEVEATMGSNYASAVMNGTVAMRDLIIAVILLSAMCLLFFVTVGRLWTLIVQFCSTSPRWAALVNWCESFPLLGEVSPTIIDDTPPCEEEEEGGIFQWFAKTLGLGGGEDISDSQSEVTDGEAPTRYTSRGWQKLKGVVYDEAFDSPDTRGDMLISGTLFKKTTRKGVGRFFKGDTWIPRLCELHENGVFSIRSTSGVSKMQFMVQQTMVQLLRKKMGKFYILEVIPYNTLAGLRGDNLKLACSSLQQLEEWLQVIALIKKNPQAIP
jgi:hypothetical protein